MTRMFIQVIKEVNELLEKINFPLRRKLPVEGKFEEKILFKKLILMKKLSKLKSSSSKKENPSSFPTSNHFLPLQSEFSSKVLYFQSDLSSLVC